MIPDDGTDVPKHLRDIEFWDAATAFYSTMKVCISTTGMRPFGSAPPGGTSKFHLCPQRST